MDSIGHYSDTARKPLFLLVGIVLLLTLRSARKGVSMTRGFGFNPFGKKAYSPYGMNGQPLYGAAGSRSQYGGATSQYGGATSQYGGAATSQYGRSTSTAYRGAVPATASSLRGGATSSYVRPVSPMASQQQASSAVNTANLVDMHGANVQVVQGLQFNDYTMTTSFMGQIETVSAMEAPSFVQQTLQSPGLGKILVVDGGASLNAAILDSAGLHPWWCYSSDYHPSAESVHRCRAAVRRIILRTTVWTGIYRTIRQSEVWIVNVWRDKLWC